MLNSERTIEPFQSEKGHERGGQNSTLIMEGT
jgi:hypothetical protein